MIIKFGTQLGRLQNRVLFLSEGTRFECIVPSVSSGFTFDKNCYRENYWTLYWIGRVDGIQYIFYGVCRNVIVPTRRCVVVYEQFPSLFLFLFCCDGGGIYDRKTISDGKYQCRVPFAFYFVRNRRGINCDLAARRCDPTGVFAGLFVGRLKEFAALISRGVDYRSSSTVQRVRSVLSRDVSKEISVG